MEALEEIRDLSFVASEMSPREAYQLLISVVVPRPIGWVSSISKEGNVNLAPFSFFNAVGGNPPTVMLSIGKRRGEEKDTLRNIIAAKEFVLNIVSEELAEAMNLTSGDWPYGENEFERAGLTMLPSTDVKPPRVAEAKATMEVKFTQLMRVNGTGYTMVLGQVVRFHVRPELLRANGTVDPESLRPLGRFGGAEYTTLGHVMCMERPLVSR